MLTARPSRRGRLYGYSCIGGVICRNSQPVHLLLRSTERDGDDKVLERTNRINTLKSIVKCRGSDVGEPEETFSENA